MSVMGTRVERREDPNFLTGASLYTADLRDPLLDGAVHAHFVRSTIAHGRITELDVAEAQAAPGVVAVYTAADIAAAGDLGSFGVPIPGMIPDVLARPWLADGVVRFVGEAVAVILAESPEAAEDASELVIVDYDPLDVLVDVLEAERDGVVLHPEFGTNTALAVPFGHSDDLFDGCEVVVTRDIVNQRVAVCPLEPRAIAVTWHEGRLIAFSSTQANSQVSMDSNLRRCAWLRLRSVEASAPRSIFSPTKRCCPGCRVVLVAPCAGPRPGARA